MDQWLFAFLVLEGIAFLLSLVDYRGCAGPYHWRIREYFLVRQLIPIGGILFLYLLDTFFR